MRVAIHNPYLDTLGGGERYTTSFARVLADNGYQVDLEWKDKSVVDLLEKRFGIKLRGINVVSDIKRGDGYDLCFWVSDGSIPALKSRKNFLHFQVPFRGVGGKSLLNKMKLFRINKIICNSQFTKNIIDKEFGVSSIIVYPPVDTDSIKSKRKENIILNVGRFSRILQNKGQDMLVKVFRDMCDVGLKGWRLILAGGIEIGVGDYIDTLKENVKGYPIEIIESPTHKTLVDLFGRSKIFWSAAGFGVDENLHPEKVEHFGITVVEAMAGGTVPIVYNAGGFKEIISDKINGYLWNTESDLVDITLKSIKDGSTLRKIAEMAKNDSAQFSLRVFEKEIFKLI